MKKQTKVLSIILSLALIISLFTGCTKSNDRENKIDPVTNISEKTDQAKKNEDKVETVNTDTVALPLVDTLTTLTYWVPMHASATQIMTDYSENVMYQELEKRTNVKIEFIHPSSGQAQEQFNLMIASQDLPDIISQFTTTYPGGVDKAIEDDVYLRLNELIDQYAPNFRGLRGSNPEIARQTSTDKGNVWSFPCLQVTEEQPWLGLIIRQDWLDDLGLQMPTSIEEWYTVLTAFRTQKNAEAPLMFPAAGVDWGGSFISAFDIGATFYMVDKQVKYAPIEPNYKEYLLTMNQWYREGLIDTDFATRDGKSTEAMITSGKAGAFIGAYEALPLYGGTIKSTDPKGELAAAPYPSLKPGGKVHFRQKNEFHKGTDTVITTACKNPELAVKWLDYAYGDEGSLLFNWGIQDVSFKMVDGQPQFTDLILNNPDGLAYAMTGWKYKLHMGPYKRDWLAYPMTPIILEAMDVWSQADADYVLPPIKLTDEESRKNSGTMTEISTYVDEKILKFIMGVDPIDQFDAFVDQIKKMGIEDMIKIRQDALERYYNR